METALSIKVNRLILAILVTFLIADTYPHPHLAPGLIETLGIRINTTLNELADR
jgi:hypothetical protein